ncbi:flippase [[Clostridium] innocuum]|nr:flippase [[Clostridium] innocuum]
MNKIQTVKKNFIMNFILTAANFIFPIVTFPYVSRILLAEGTGKVAFAASIASYFSMIAALGIPTYGIRACARIRDDKDKLNKTVQELLIIHMSATSLALMFYFISVFIVPELYKEKTLMLINSLSIILNVFGVNWLYQALEQYSYITYRSIFFKIISIILMFFFIHQKSDYIIYGGIAIFANAGSNILNFIRLRKLINFKKVESYSFLVHIRPILVFFAQSVAITVYTNLDTVMLGFMQSDIEVGYYNAAIKIKTILLSLVTSLGTVLLPRLSYCIQKNDKIQFQTLISKSIRFVFIIALPLTIFFILFAKETLIVLSGRDFVGATLAMQIITPTILLIGLSNITGIQILTPLGKEKIVVYSVTFGAILDLIVNYICIPRLGAAGASLGTLIAEFSVLAVQIMYTSKQLHEVKCGFKIFKIIISCLFASILVLFINLFTDFTVFFSLFVYAILFFGSYVICLILLKEEFVVDYIYKGYSALKTRR